MPEVIVRFYEELNEHLTSEKRQKDFKVSYEGKRKVREVIGEQGPHRGGGSRSCQWTIR